MNIALQAHILGGMLTISALVFAQGIPAPVDQERLDLGRQVWEASGCAGCHGVTGQGGTEPDLPAGPSLRGRRDREGLVEATRCGVPGTRMAAWLTNAYTITPCYGKETGNVPAGVVVIGTLDEDQIEALADFILKEFSSEQ